MHWPRITKSTPGCKEWAQEPHILLGPSRCDVSVNRACRQLVFPCQSKAKICWSQARFCTETPLIEYLHWLSMAALGFLGLLCYIFKVDSALILTLPTEITFRGFSWAALHYWEDGTSEAKLHLLLPDFPSPPGTGCCILARGLVLWDILSAFRGWHGVLHHCSGKLLTVVQHCRRVWFSQMEWINEMLMPQSSLYCLFLDPVIRLKTTRTFHVTIFVASSNSRSADKLLARVGGVLRSWQFHKMGWADLITYPSKRGNISFSAPLLAPCSFFSLSDGSGVCWVLYGPITLTSPEQFSAGLVNWILEGHDTCQGRCRAGGNRILWPLDGRNWRVRGGRKQDFLHSAETLGLLRHSWTSAK